MKSCRKADISALSINMSKTICFSEPCEQADIVFVIDNSGSIRDNNPEDDSYDNYLLLLEFVVDIVSTLKIGSAHTRVGLVSFSGK